MNIIQRACRDAVLIAVLAIPSFALAEPNDVASDFFQHLQNDDYIAAAGLFDPTELQEFRELLRFMYENTENKSGELVAALFGEGVTTESISEMSDAQFFASFLSLTMQEMKKTLPMGFSGVETLGYVSESPELAHVVTRFSIDMSEGGISAVDVVSVRRVGDDWRILMQADMKALAQQLKAAYGTAN